MRVTGGDARGRRLKTPKGSAVRPTSGRVKEALFNILPRNLEGAKLLDLFAGTGNVSIEALSRGAAQAILVDSSSQSTGIIRENLHRLRLADRAQIWNTPVSRALRLLAQRGETFDVIFLDPPYERGWVEPSLKTVARHGLLRPSGVLVVEHSARELVKPTYVTLALDDRRKYGDTCLSFFRYKAESAVKQ